MSDKAAHYARRAANLIIALAEHNPVDATGSCALCGAYLDLDHPHDHDCLWVEARTITKAVHLTPTTPPPFHEESDKETSS